MIGVLPFSSEIKLSLFLSIRGTQGLPFHGARPQIYLIPLLLSHLPGYSKLSTLLLKQTPGSSSVYPRAASYLWDDERLNGISEKEDIKICVTSGFS